jgi:hypothetical protein
LRISSLCGAGNEIGAAAGAILALGLTFFKVCSSFVLFLCAASPLAQLSRIGFNARAFIQLVSALLTLPFRSCIVSPTLFLKKPNALLAIDFSSMLGYFLFH